MDMNDDSDEFVRLLTESQPALYGYISSLIFDGQQAWDVLQEVNLTIWKKRDNFTLGTSFMSWATAIAFRHAQAHRRKSGRRPFVVPDASLDHLAQKAAERTELAARKTTALSKCVDGLAPRQRDVLAQRYGHRRSVKDIASSSGMTEGAVSQLLRRIRQVLRECIDSRLASEGAND